MKKLNFLPVLVLVAGLAACNKDGVIYDDDDIIGGIVPEVPVTPEVPDKPTQDADGVFAGPSYLYNSTTRYTLPGRPVLLTPVVDGSSYEWRVNGEAADCSTSTFKFTPDKAGEYTVSVTIDKTVTGSVKVVCEPYSEADCYRAGSSKTLIVYEYIAAPGQFINEKIELGSADEAAKWAAERLAKGQLVSLGAFGGYITVGFGHSIRDFVAKGNAFTNAGGASNEPGIVYVMQDVNRNGLPDDEWYELRGSAYSAKGTVQNYAVTYYRPDAVKSPVKWVDKFGVEGQVDYVEAFHKQDCYYPSWIKADSYTLRGTRLPYNAYKDDTGQWITPPFESGYVDNTGSNQDEFHISDAMFADGAAVSLDFIDFIKIQTGVCGNYGVLGEISTEVTEVHEL
ncbi:MAG: hypothetical protein K2M12_00770 [Muribaculaceae bacterium]|nr:hypothetical protein [Muribaculaceae bacterium]